MMKAKTRLTFEEIIARLEKLELPDIDYVVGILRGGVIPAALAANKLNKDIGYIHIHFRDEQNQPQHQHPVVLDEPRIPAGVKRILMVDEASVTGQTLECAKERLSAYDVKTLAFKGKADFVLFPEIKGCVLWPWKVQKEKG